MGDQMTAELLLRLQTWLSGAGAHRAKSFTKPAKAASGEASLVQTPASPSFIRTRAETCLRWSDWGTLGHAISS
jgi:hypothetical protein